MIENYLLQSGPLFAFNIWDINSAQAVLDGAILCEKSVILQTSTSIFSSIDKKMMRKFVKSYISNKNINAWLHLDHCRDLNMIKLAVDLGWDSVMIDASEKSLQENIYLTNEVAEYAHKRRVLVESEIGQIKGTEDDIIIGRSTLASKEDISFFLENTNEDMIAIAFGNAHGVYPGDPELHFDLVEYTVQKKDIPFVVHGGSGMPEQMLLRLLSIPQVKKINISTEVKLAYREGILRAQRGGMLEKKSFQATNVERCIHDTIVEMVVSKLKLIPE